MRDGGDPYLECLYAPVSSGPSPPAQRSTGLRVRPPVHTVLSLLCLGFTQVLGGRWGLVLSLALGVALGGDADSSRGSSALHSSNSSEDLVEGTNSTSLDARWPGVMNFPVKARTLLSMPSHWPCTLLNTRRLSSFVSSCGSPFQGPSLFDFLRSESAAVLHAKLLAAGHDPTRRALYIAFDTQSTVVDLVSVPPAGGRWWIVRDGFSRELLRPVTTWVDDERRSVVTLNSHGQAASLATSPEVASLYNLPQGARGVTATPLSRVYGHLTAAGLLLVEASIGTVSSSTPRLGVLLSFVLLWSSPGWAMMQTQVVASRTHSLWQSPQVQPRRIRVWTHTLAAPVTVPYSPEPDPEFLSTIVADTRRGVRGDGVFAWTIPTQVSDSAHMLHYPAGLCPPYVFWLLHYRGRGSVICATSGPMDWQYLAQEASEAFASQGFLQGSFGIQHNGRIFAYGSDLVAPPHGTILHLVRMGSRPSSSAAASIWEAPAELPWIPQFDYDICRGPRGEDPIVPDSCESTGLLRALLMNSRHLCRICSICLVA